MFFKPFFWDRLWLPFKTLCWRTSCGKLYFFLLFSLLSVGHATNCYYHDLLQAMTQWEMNIDEHWQVAWSYLSYHEDGRQMQTDVLTLLTLPNLKFPTYGASCDCSLGLLGFLSSFYFFDRKILNHNFRHTSMTMLEVHLPAISSVASLGTALLVLRLGNRLPKGNLRLCM